MDRLQGTIPRRYAIALKREQLRHLSILPTPEAARQLQVSRRTVRSWRRRLHNPDYLNIKSPKGRQWLLPLDARQFLVNLVNEPATLYGFEDPHWTSRKVQDMVLRRYNISISRVTAWNYLRRSNLTPQKPGTLYREQDPVKKQKWLTQDYPAILDYAKKHNAIIYFQDESGIALSPPVSRTWGTRGKTPTLRIPAKRGGIACISSVSTEGTLHHWVWKGSMESDVIYNYLVDLKFSHPDREVVVIMDNAPTHTSKWLKLNIAAIPGLHVRRLPPYSPELNPDEKVWRHLKRNKLRHHGARSQEALMKLVSKKMNEIAQDTQFLLNITREFSHAP
jgi:transposase